MIETITLETIKVLSKAIFATSARVLVGWLPKAIDKDGDLGEKISTFEWKELTKTLVRSIVITSGLHFGFNIDDVALTATLAAIIDYAYMKFKKD